MVLLSTEASLLPPVGRGKGEEREEEREKKQQRKK